eukprot:scaffold5726_cov116-Isochrysis_galbana.AAC.7
MPIVRVPNPLAALGMLPVGRAGRRADASTINTAAPPFISGTNELHMKNFFWILSKISVEYSTKSKIAVQFCKISDQLHFQLHSAPKIADE